MRGGDVGQVVDCCTSTLLRQLRLPMRQGIFLCYGVRTPPQVQLHALTSACARIKDPVVHVRVWWITETLKHPACTVGWQAWLCRSWLSLRGKQPEFPMAEIPMEKYSCKNKTKKETPKESSSIHDSRTAGEGPSWWDIAPLLRFFSFVKPPLNIPKFMKPSTTPSVWAVPLQ